jgi:hypothetical protein
MAWRSHGATNKELIENLYTNKLIKDVRVKEAFLKVIHTLLPPFVFLFFPDIP